MIIPPTESEISRFSGKYNIDPVTGCWLWTAAVDKTGYGAFSGDRGLRKRNDNWRAHRFSWLIHRGQIPEGLGVLHRCDVPRCVNPDHLFLGDHDANMADKIAKKRQSHGENHGAAKLTDEQVLFIRTSNLRPRFLRRMFGVGDTAIAYARDGRRWKHLPMPQSGRPESDNDRSGK